MSALTEAITKGLLKIEADLESPTFDWQGESYFCVPSSDEKLLSLERGGFGVEKVLNLVVRSEQFANDIFPQSQDLITYRGADYTIANTKLDPTGTILRLACVSDTRGA